MKPNKETNLTESTPNGITYFEKWTGPENDRSEAYTDFIEAIASGATIPTALARVGLDIRTFGKWMQTSGEPFDSFRDLVQKSVSNAVMFSEQKLQEKNPEKYLKMTARYIPGHPLNELEQIEEKKEDKKVVDYSNHEEKLGELAKLYLNSPSKASSSPPNAS